MIHTMVSRNPRPQLPREMEDYRRERVSTWNCFNVCMSFICNYRSDYTNQGWSGVFTIPFSKWQYSEGKITIRKATWALGLLECVKALGKGRFLFRITCSGPLTPRTSLASFSLKPPAKAILRMPSRNASGSRQSKVLHTTTTPRSLTSSLKSSSTGMWTFVSLLPTPPGSPHVPSHYSVLKTR